MTVVAFEDLHRPRMNPMRFSHWPSLVLLSHWLLPALALASDVELQVRDRVPQGSQPAVRVTARQEVSQISIRLKRFDGKEFDLGGPVGAGETREFFWAQPQGSYHYRGEARVRYANGSTSQIDLEFEVRVVAGLKVSVGAGGFSLNQRYVRLSSSRPLVRVELELRDAQGKTLGKVERALSGALPDGRFEARWDPVAGSIAKVLATGHDGEGFWASVEIVPFAIFIPHDEVVFETAKAVVRRSETPKLDATLERIHDAIRKNAEVEDLRLYVAGYTDTVGGREYNLRLSERRARSIARYFRKKGLRIPIFYQGFGKEVLAVKTPDQTPEERNRRALYLLANHTPEISRHFPRADWKRVR
jgi:outer membrane protein OmpA-like peptidoglycan-associated protein